MRLLQLGDARHQQEKFTQNASIRPAVDARHQRQGLGELLLMDALHRCLLLSEEIGMIGVVLDAKHKQAKAYYQRYEFEEFPDAPLTLWLPVGAMQKLFR